VWLRLSVDGGGRPWTGRSAPAGLVRAGADRSLGGDGGEHVEAGGAAGRERAGEQPGYGGGADDGQQLDDRHPDGQRSVRGQPGQGGRGQPEAEGDAATATAAMSTASARTIRDSWAGVVPTARSNPISRVRSTIDSATVLVMPSRAMTTAKPSSTVISPRTLGTDHDRVRPLARRTSRCPVTASSFSVGPADPTGPEARQQA
jgi:hypothetical protein